MADIEVGDTLFDECGRPTVVTATFERVAERAYRVHFSDGTHLDACDEHQWVTWTHAERKALLRRKIAGKEVRTGALFPDDWAAKAPITTAEMERTCFFRTGQRQGRNHSIPLARPLQLPEADLPIEPYLLGCWLGDGTYNAGYITVAEAEVLPDLLRQAGHQLHAVPSSANRNGAIVYRVEGLSTALVRCGLVGRRRILKGKRGRYAYAANKHVPAAYLRASASQRLALLQGLMDTDGYIDPVKGTVEFCSTNRALADAVVELARSLGQKPVLSVGRATLNGRFVSAKFRVTFAPTIDVFRLPRKSAVWASTSNRSQGLRRHHRMVTSVEPIEPGPMRCLVVDSPNHMYLAGEGMIPTHNSWSASHLFAEWITAPDAAGEWAIIAPDWSRLRTQCIESKHSGLLVALGVTKLSQIGTPGCWVVEYRRTEPYFLLLANGAEIYTASTNNGADTIQGRNLRGVWAEEVGLWDKWEIAWYEGVEMSTRSGRSRVIVTGTPKSALPAKELVKKLLADAEAHPELTIVSHLRTVDNLDHLSERSRLQVQALQGTRLGRQELEGELLDDNPDALWNLDVIDRYRLDEDDAIPDMIRVVIGVDPASRSGKRIYNLIAETMDDDGSGNNLPDETGIVIVGLGTDMHGYVLADLSGRYRPSELAHVLSRAFHMWQADRVVAELNFGYDWIPQLLGTVDTSVVVKAVRASRGKALRAEPLAAAYVNGLVHHVGVFPELETQMCQWSPFERKSPDRLDALVWACTDLELVVGEIDWSNMWSVAPENEKELERANPWLAIWRDQTPVKAMDPVAPLIASALSATETETGGQGEGLRGRET